MNFLYEIGTKLWIIVVSTFLCMLMVGCFHEIPALLRKKEYGEAGVRLVVSLGFLSALMVFLGAVL